MEIQEKEADSACAMSETYRYVLVTPVVAALVLPFGREQALSGIPGCIQICLVLRHAEHLQGPQAPTSHAIVDVDGIGQQPMADAFGKYCFRLVEKTAFGKHPCNTRQSHIQPRREIRLFLQ